MERRRQADVCVIGAGAAGCVLAARLSEDPARRVCLVEAGPDYGHLEQGRWPADLLDASDCATSHDWGYGIDSCCRVVGGSSAHNGCLVVWGTPADYDEWSAATGDPGWGWDRFAPYLRQAEQAIGTRRFEADEVGGWTRRALDGWAALGERHLESFNAPPARTGYGLVPVNRRGRLRLGAAFAYLDPARARPNLEILADAPAERVLLEHGRVRGVLVHRDGAPALVEAPAVVLAAGAYGSPAVLLRSGIGPADELRALGVPVTVDLPGVGRGLVDHPAVHVRCALRPAAAAELAADDARGALTHVQAKLKAASSRCPPGTLDLHLLPNLAWETDEAGRRTGRHAVSLIPVLLKPRSAGTVRLQSADPGVPPTIDRNLFTDPDGHDLAVLRDGVERARELLGSAPMREAAEETAPGPSRSGTALDDWLRETAFALYHPCGTCRLGRPDDPSAVADGHGRLRGVEGLRVADAAAFPTVPRANTHLSVLALAERIAECLRAG